MTALLATAAVLAAWLVAAAALCGLGGAARWALGGRGDAAFDDLFWLGWGTCLACLQLWHLALAVNGLATVVFVLAGVTGLALRPEARRSVLRILRRAATWRGLALALLALWVADLALAGPHHGDSGLYHLAAVRWDAEYPIVPGLGNLHGRLAFNSSYFLWVALLGGGPLAGRGFHLANGVLLLVPLLRSVVAVERSVRGEGRLQPAALFDALMLYPLLERVWNLHYLTSPEPDLPVFILGIVAASALARLVETDGPGAQAPASAAGDAAAVAVVAAFAGLVTKLSFAGYAAATVAVVVGFELARRNGGRAALGRRAAVAAAALLAAPWMARGVILSGYPLYPFPRLRFPADWAVPLAAAQGEYAEVRSWARAPNLEPAAVLADWRWLGPWLREMTASAHALVMVALPLLAGALALTVIGLRLAVHRPSATSSVRLLLVSLPAAGGLIYWFCMAPALRFAGSAFWVLGGSLVVAAVAGMSGRLPGRVAAWASVGLAAAALAHEVWQRGPLVVAAGPDAGFHPPPRVVLATRTTASGLDVLTPARGEACWDAPLPCSPLVATDLRLRVPGRLGSGFARGPVAGSGGDGRE